MFGYLTVNIIKLDPSKRGDRPCIRGLRVSVYDVLSMLASGMSQQEILDDFPELVLDYPEHIIQALEKDGLDIVELRA
jgi:uncharacterized protein (DUF433 family)